MAVTTLFHLLSTTKLTGWADSCMLNCRACAGDQANAQTASPNPTVMASSPGAFALCHLDADQTCMGHQNNRSPKDGAVVLAAPTREAWRLATAAQQSGCKHTHTAQRISLIQAAARTFMQHNE